MQNFVQNCLCGWWSVCVEQRRAGFCHIMRPFGNLYWGMIWTRETEKRQDRPKTERKWGEMKWEIKDEQIRKRTNGARGRRCIVLTNLQGVVFPLEIHLDNTRPNTHTHMAGCYQYCFLQWWLSWWCAPITQPGAAYVWSPQQRESYMAHNTIDQNLSAHLCMCVCVCACVPVCFLCAQACFSHFRSCKWMSVFRRTWHKWERARMLFTKLL